jgi:hypothetical protein
MSSTPSQNIVHMPDGTLQIFPGEASPDQIAVALQQAQQPSSLQIGVPSNPGVQSTPTSLDPVLNKAVDFIRPFIGNAVGGLAGAAAAPFGGPVGAFGAETQGYAGIDTLLQQLKTGDKPALGESVSEAEKEALINAVGGRIMGGLFRGAKTFVSADQPEIYNFKPTTSQALESFGYHTLATSAKFAEDFGASGAKSDALDRAGGAGFTQALKFANAINGRTYTINSDPVKLADKIRNTLEQGLQGFPSGSAITARGNPLYQASDEALQVLAGGQNPYAKIDAVIQDPDRLAKVLTAGQLAGQAGSNVRKDLQSYQFMRMINDATTKDATGNIRIDPTKITKVFNDPDMNTSLDTLYGKQGRQNVSDFIKNIAATQDQQKSYPVAKALRLVDGGVAFGAGLLTGNIHLASGAAGVAGLFVPSAVVGNLLTKESTARVVTAMAGAEPLGQSSQLASKLVTDALQGTSVALMGSDGKKTWGTFDKNGNFVENK